MMKTKDLVRNALFLGLLCVITLCIVIPLPAGMGYINLSDAFIMLSCTTLPLFSAMFVAGIGCMLADILLGYSQYAIFTLIVKAVEALLVVSLLKKIKKPYIAFIIGGLWMMLGYGISDWILAGSFEYLTISMIANLPQALGCSLIACLGYPMFQKLLNRFK